MKHSAKIILILILFQLSYSVLKAQIVADSALQMIAGERASVQNQPKCIDQFTCVKEEM